MTDGMCAMTAGGPVVIGVNPADPTVAALPGENESDVLFRHDFRARLSVFFIRA